MTAGEKIVERILLDAELEGKKITDEAEAKAKEIISAAKAEAKASEQALSEKADKKAERIIETAESGAALILRNALLKCRREGIESTVAAVFGYLNALPADEYFDAILSTASSIAADSDGVMFLNSADIARMPADFQEKLLPLHITVSDTADDKITGGFILKYKDIEINEDFTAVIAEKREQLEDLINAELF